ncbi:MAG: rRNA pseudouridine synthase [Lachnospiraceae bacterium]|nr:rRNA pseudouridine synthase [Lachnospiraceae bacterium]
MRVNKYLAQAGICSRRQADRLIAEGKVTVNGAPATEGMQVEDTDVIMVEGRLVGQAPTKVVLAYYKPKGVVCTHSDPHAEETVFDHIDYPQRLNYAGRLDKDSEGLLLLTNDGDLIQRMMRGANGHEKEYEVTIDRPVTEDFLERMRQGIYLPELTVTTRACKAEKTTENGFRIILTQGLNRQIRRMCKECGCEVVDLKRVRVVTVTLEGLQPDTYRELSAEEIAELESVV